MVTHAEINSHPVIGRYVSNDIQDITDGLKKGALYDELSKRAIYKGLGVKNMTHKDLMEETHNVLKKNHPERGEDLKRTFDSYKEAYDHSAGRRQSLKPDNGHIIDWLGRNASSLAMAKYGKNLGFAQGAETLQAFADRARLTGTASSFVAGIAGMFDGMSPRAREELGRNLNFTLAHIRGEMNTRVMGTRDESTAPKGWFDRLIGKMGDLSTRYGGAYIVQRFNKTYAAATGMQLQLRDMSSAMNLARLLSEAGNQIDGKTFKRLASEAGFGRRFSDAMRWREAGLLQPEKMEAAIELLNAAMGTYNRKLWSPDDMQAHIDRVDPKDPRYDGLVAAQEMLLDMVEDYVSKINIEPRLMDTNLSPNAKASYHRVMDVYLAWPRAFYSQRIGRAGRYTGAELSTLLSAQYVWDTMYRAVRSMMGGSLAAELVHEWANDPIGKAASNAFMLPVFGGWTWMPQAMLDMGRDFAAGSDIGIGYSNPKAWKMNMMSSPVGAAANAIATLGVMNGKSILELLSGQTTVDNVGMQLLSQANQFMPLVNNMAIASITEQYIAMNEQKSYSRRGYKRYYDYLTRLHNKRARKKWGTRNVTGRSR